MRMKAFRWSLEKNRRFTLERRISFEEVVAAIAHGGLLDVLEHPNKRLHPNQRLFVVRIRGYAYLAPFVESEHEIFLKTIIPSRKATRKYLGKEV